MPKSNVVTIATAPPPAASIEVRQIAVHALHPSANNPRRTFDDAAMAELQATIAGKQIHTPLIVRPKDFGTDEVSYEIVAGHRRHRAAVALGMATVPCVVRELSDAEADELAIVDNLQRADVHPVEEAQAFQRLMETLGSIPAVAARLGKEQSYVAKVLRLNALTLHSQDALRGRLITIDHALLLARLAEAEQSAALKWCLDRNAGVKVPVEKVVADRLAKMQPKPSAPKPAEYDESVEYEDEGDDELPGRRPIFMGYKWEPESVVRLKAWIEGEAGIVLERAPWSLTDEDYLLPDVGPCVECPKNTSANAPLFGDLVTGVPVCTDGACFAAKTSGFVQIALRQAGHDEQAKPKVLVPRLSWKSSSVKPSIVPNDGLAACSIKSATETANPSKVLKHGQWHEAKPGSCPNVRPGVTVDWSDAGDRGCGQKLRKPGETLQVCIAVGCKVHRKDYEKPKRASGNEAPPKETPEQKAQREAEAKAYVDAERPVRIAFLRELVDKAMAKPEPILRELVSQALEYNWSVDHDALATTMVIAVKGKDAEGAVERWIATARVDELLRMAVAVSNAELLDVEGPGSKDRERKRLDEVAKKYGMTWKNPDAPAVAKKAAPAKKAVKAPAKKSQKATRLTLTPKQRKNVADAIQKHVAERGAKKVGA